MDTTHNQNEPLTTVLLARINLFKQEEQLCDFTICVGNKKIRVHRLILAALSEYFRAMLFNDTIERDSGYVKLHDIDQEAVESIINFFYTSKIDLNQDNIEEVTVTACILQTQVVQDLCREFMEKCLDVSTCLRIFELSDRCNLVDLKDKAYSYCLKHFQQITHQTKFLELDDTTLISMIEDNKLDVENETEVFQAVIDWIKGNLDARRGKLAKLLTKVRIALIEPAALLDVANNDLVRESHECRELIDTAKNYLLLKDDPKKQTIYCKHLVTNPRDSFRRKQRIYAFGGWTDEFRSIASAEVYDPVTDTWVEILPMNQRRCGVGSTTLDNSIYAVGGHDGQNYLNSVERFDIKAGEWFRDVADMKYVRTSVGVATLNGFIYAIGGQMSTDLASDRVEKYFPKLNIWRECAPLNKKRLGAGVAIHNGSIYVMGGSDGKYIHSSVERYDPEKDSWTNIESMNTYRKHLGSCTSKGKIFAVGGRNEQGELDSAETYDPTLKTWSMIAPMQMKRSGIGLVEIGNQVYAIGGQNQDARLAAVEAYDHNLNSWDFRKQMVHKRLGGGMTVHPFPNHICC